jgi:hypothetical protein
MQPFIVNPLSSNVPKCTLLCYVALSNTRRFYFVKYQTILLLKNSVLLTNELSKLSANVPL